MMGMMLVIGAGVALAVTLAGDKGPDMLVGTDENDVIGRRRSAEELVGKDEPDRLVGGHGKDFIDARKRPRGRSCGLRPGTRYGSGRQHHRGPDCYNCEIVRPGVRRRTV